MNTDEGRRQRCTQKREDIPRNSRRFARPKPAKLERMREERAFVPFPRFRNTTGGAGDISCNERGYLIPGDLEPSDPITSQALLASNDRAGLEANEAGQVVRSTVYRYAYRTGGAAEMPKAILYESGADPEVIERVSSRPILASRMRNEGKSGRSTVRT